MDARADGEDQVSVASDTMTAVPEPLGLGVEVSGDTAFVQVSGEIDAATSDEFARVLRQAIERDVRRLVLDVAAVDFIDSSGLRALVQAHRAVQGQGGEMVLRAPTDTFRRLLDVTGLDEVFTLE
jgi:anti-sigma B factor antagonist